MPATETSEPQEEITRTEVRPGLVMVKRRTLKPDGRYLLYYDFEHSTPSPAAAGEPNG